MAAPKKTAVRRKPIRKKAPPRKQQQTKPLEGFVQYADPRLKPIEPAETVHPAFKNSPDQLHVFPGTMAVIKTGLEIALPPSALMLVSPAIDGLVVYQTIRSGYHKDLTLEMWNNTSVVIHLGGFEKIADLYLALMQSWK